MGAGCDIRLPNDDHFSGLFSAQRDRFATARRAYGLSIDGRGAVFANYAVRSLVKTHRSANLAGIEDGGDFAVGFLVEPEANRGPIFFGLKAVEIAIRDLGQRNAYLPVLEG